MSEINRTADTLTFDQKIEEVKTRWEAGDLIPPAEARDLADHLHQLKHTWLCIGGNPEGLDKLAEAAEFLDAIAGDEV